MRGRRSLHDGAAQGVVIRPIVAGMRGRRQCRRRTRSPHANEARIAPRLVGFAWKNDYLTSNSWLATGLPSMVISTLYLPTGQPSGLETWKVVVAGPVGAIDWLPSSTSWPSP